MKAQNVLWVKYFDFLEIIYILLYNLNLHIIQSLVVFHITCFLVNGIGDYNDFVSFGVSTVSGFCGIHRADS